MIFFTQFGRVFQRQFAKVRKFAFATYPGRALIASTLVYNFESDDAAIKRPEKPIEFPKLENLTTESVIRQACALSAEQV
jgi:hypothetical protein